MRSSTSWSAGSQVRWALGEGGRLTDPEGAFIELQRQFGNPVLIALIPGFFSYALWRVLAAIYDSERDGSNPSGIANRIFGVVKARSMPPWRRRHPARLRYWRWIDRLVRENCLERGRAGGHADRRRGFFLFACYEMYRAYHARLSQGLRLDNISSRARSCIVAISRFGIAARSLVIGAFGWLVVRAVLSGHAARTPRPSETIRTAAQSEPALYILIGAGLIAYGAYLVVLSRYRRVET
jgi:hypothetical protein